MQTPTTHRQFIIERTIPCEPPDIFNAYRDVTLRSSWGVPAGEVMLYERSDFSVGGEDHYRCGPKGDPRFVVKVQYQDIVENSRIVYVERASLDGTALFAALVTIELEPSAGQARLVLTDQMASFVGSEMIEGAERGTAAAIDNLVALMKR
ncbi:MAG: SRPBCC domain-containing protein [Planctomycetota bacterium]